MKEVGGKGIGDKGIGDKGIGDKGEGAGARAAAGTAKVARVPKPWGYEIHWAVSERYVGKILHINAGHALSLQYHKLKDETVYVHSGTLLYEIEIDGVLTRREMGPGDAIHVPPGTVHRMTAIEDCDVLEASTPELNDVVRLQDNYGREGT
jgi:quercetin dioxygenase-like cupin family protein